MTADPFDSMLATLAAPRKPTHFPLTLTVLTVAITSLGLSASALAIKWGNHPPAGEAFSFAWLYVNEMLLSVWFLAWPAIALRPRRLDRAALPLHQLSWDLSGILIGSIPALACAAVVARTPGAAILGTLTTQCSLALFTLGLLALASTYRNRPPIAIIAATLLATIATATPILAYLRAEFFSTSSSAWTQTIPALVIHRISYLAESSAIPRAILWTTTAYAIAGALLLLISLRSRFSTQSKK